MDLWVTILEDVFYQQWRSQIHPKTRVRVWGERDDNTTNPRWYSTLYKHGERTKQYFFHHNPRINLYHILPNLHAPQQRPLTFHDHGDSESSPEDFYDATLDFRPQNTGYNNQYYSDVKSQNHTNPPPDFSNSSVRNLTPSSLRERFNPSPSLGRRYGFVPDLRASITPQQRKNQNYTSLSTNTYRSQFATYSAKHWPSWNTRPKPEWK